MHIRKTSAGFSGAWKQTVVRFADCRLRSGRMNASYSPRRSASRDDRQRDFLAFQNGADDLSCVLSWVLSMNCGAFRGGRSLPGKNWQIPSVMGLDYWQR